MTPEKIRAHIMPLLLERLDSDTLRRNEALGDFLALSLPGLSPESIKGISSLVPRLPTALYRKWINLFIDRLLETIPQAQLIELCDSSPDNNATLSLVYLMFMESARMENQVAADLADLGLQCSGSDLATDALAVYLKAKLSNKMEKSE